MKTIAILIFCFVVTCHSMPPIQERPLTFDEEQREVHAIFGEIAAIMRERHADWGSSEATDETKIDEKFAPYDDVLYSLEDAKRMLEQVKAGESPDKDRRVVAAYNLQWPLPIRYRWDGLHNDAEKEIIREGFKWWADETCVTFEEHPAGDTKLDKVPHVQLMKTRQLCATQVGKYGTALEHPLYIDPPGCFTPGIAAHEVGHLLGMNHEHSTGMRDAFVRIINRNILPNDNIKVSFNIAQQAENYYGTPYDFASIMHYDSLGFSQRYSDRLRTLETLNPRKLATIGDRTRLSFIDVKRINAHYKCIQKNCAGVNLTRPCQNGGYQDPKNCVKCRCPYGIGGDFCELLAGHWNGPEKCGGVVEVEPCSTKIIRSPLFDPDTMTPYPSETDCSWHIKTKAGGLIIGNTGMPATKCSFGEVCIDYYEIRSNLSRLDAVGDRFCDCAKSAGRVAVIDGQEAQIYFHSAPDRFKHGRNGFGFELSIFATCSDKMPASKVTKECVVTESGYDYEGSELVQTESGKTCLPWAKKLFSPREMDYFPDKSLLDAGNKCRNPSFRHWQPWCYTDAAYTVSDPCKMPPLCQSLPIEAQWVNETTTTTTTTTTSTTTPPPPTPPRTVPRTARPHQGKRNFMGRLRNWLHHNHKHNVQADKPHQALRKL